ncbi:hypothetical protein [Alkalibaculum sporogenes]|nr:hypothetical protein [Alkalibaculum sporogenes]
MSENREKELLKKLNEMENKFNNDTEKKNVIITLKDNLEKSEFSGPEADVKKIQKDLISVIIELLTWI